MNFDPVVFKPRTISTGIPYAGSIFEVWDQMDKAMAPYNDIIRRKAMFQMNAGPDISAQEQAWLDGYHARCQDDEPENE